MLVNAIVTLNDLLGDDLMTRRFGMTCVIGLALFAGAGSASAFVPAGFALTGNASGDVVEASFFGRPYPYGYTSWGPCVRYVEVKNSLGLTPTPRLGLPVKFTLQP